MNQTRVSILKNTGLAIVGLFFFGFGIYLCLQANIGLAPWDALNMGVSESFGISYGTANIIVSLFIVVLDLLMREQIGLGMLIDAILVGKFVDLFDFLNLIPPRQDLVTGILTMLLGLSVIGFSQSLYMKAALGCGARDALLVGLKRRTKRIPIGVISILLLATATVLGWILGAKIGIGTVIGAFLEGPIMQWEFQLIRFDPTEVPHQGVLKTVKILVRGQ